MRHTADVHKAVAALAAVAAAHAHGAVNPNDTYAYRILNAPTTSDERAIRTLGIQPEAQRISDALFAALSSVLGGQAPRLNFTPTGDPLTPSDFSATPATNTVNVDPLGIWSLTDPNSPYHSASVLAVPHEQSHLRQTAQVFADLATREGGAQAFADLVTPVAAQRAGLTFDPARVNDGTYADYTKQAQARGNDWLLNGQFGQSGHTWP